MFPPARRSELVARPWLAERLDATLDRGHRLTLVSAPAGFGKTTLVGDWASRRSQVGWLSLDAGDTLSRFVRQSPHAPTPDPNHPIQQDLA